jgi:acyl dehydratase
MEESSIITDKLKKLIGTGPDPSVYKVEEGAIQRYADAIGDINPLFNDVGYAKKSRYGRLMCPPGFFGWPTKAHTREVSIIIGSLVAAGAPPRGLDAGVEYEFFESVGAGDVLTCSTRIISLSERDGKTGKMLITNWVTMYLNQNGDVVAKATASLINR